MGKEQPGIPNRIDPRLEMFSVYEKTRSVYPEVTIRDVARAFYDIFPNGGVTLFVGLLTQRNVEDRMRANRRKQDQKATLSSLSDTPLEDENFLAKHTRSL